MTPTEELVQKMIAGDKLALARLLSLIEKDSADVTSVMRAVSPRTGHAYCVGFTGPPGAGKSTLVDQLTFHVRSKESKPTVGIIAVDPTSPFSGGAILGDRIRMQQHYSDEGVFIRSMATRGSHGGLPTTAGKAVKLLDASGKDFVFVETVGVGQTELDIMELADTVVVVLAPESGDAIQTMKAGLMEIADVFVVNKADRPGADNLVTELLNMLQMSPKQEWWKVPVLMTQAHNGKGIAELSDAIEGHRKALEASGNLAERRRERRKAEFLRAIEKKVSAGLRETIQQNGHLKASVAKVESGEVDPYSAAEDVLRQRDIVRNWFGTPGD